MRQTHQTLLLLLACLLLPLYALATPGNETLQQVRLQLNWKHQFEFAGHYAALEKGIYRRNGLDVELVEYQHGIDVIDEVLSGNADYGLFSLQIIEERLKGKPITLLANYFKRYPLAILSQPGIYSLEELRGKRLMISDKDLGSSLMRYLFQRAGLEPGENLTAVPHSFNTQPFIDGEVDGLVAYLSNEPFELIQRKKAYQIIDLATVFPALGSNYLFSRETDSSELLERHQRFLEATNEGWQYALQHPDEIIALILKKYSQRKSREALQFEADKTRNFIMPRAFPIGSIQPDRIQAVADMLREMGTIQDTSRLDGFVSAPVAHTSSTVELTATEQAWIQRHPRIRVANEDDWPPYDFSETGVPSGYAIDLVRLVAQKVGLQLEFVNGYSWDELLQMGREGSIDLFPAIWKTPERETFLNFTAPYTETPHILLVREEDNRIRGIQDLRGRILAGIKGYADVEMVKQHYPEITVREVANISEGLRAVAYGHADAYLGTLGAASHALREEQLTGLKILGETTLEGRLLAGEMHFATLKDLPLLASIVQKGLDAVSRTERMAIQDRWLFTPADLPVAEADNGDSSLYGSIGIAVTIALLALFTVALLPRLISEHSLTRYIGSTQFRAVVIVALGVMVVLVLLLVEQSLRRNHQQVLEQTRGELEIVLKTAVQRLEDWEGEQKRYLLQLGRDAELVRLTRKLLAVPPDSTTLRQSDEQAAIREFFELHADEFGTTDFFIINRDGISVGSRRDGNLGDINLIAQQQAHLFETALSGRAVFIPPIESEVHTGEEPPTAAPPQPTTMFFAIPITAEDGSVLAVMTQRMQPEGQLSELMKYGRTGLSGESYAIDRQGRLVTSSRFREQLIEIGLLKRSEQVHGRLMVRDPGGELLKGYRPTVAKEQWPLTRMAQAVHDAAVMEESTHLHEHKHQHAHHVSSDMSGYRGYRGVAVFGAWAWVSHLGLGIITEIEADEALAGYYSMRKNLFIITGLTLLLAVSAVVITLILAGRATQILRRSHEQLEGLVGERTEELSTAREMLQMVLNTIPVRVFWKDYDGRYLGCNSLFARDAGLENIEQIIGRDDTQMAWSEQAELYRRDDLAVMDSGQSKLNFEEPQTTPEGNTIWLETSKIPLTDKQGNSIGILGTYQEITERKRHHEELEQAILEAQEANRAKSEFLSSMSHELRTPLNAVLGFSQLLANEENLTDEQRESVQDIFRAGSHLLELINEVLDLSRIEAGKLVLSIEPVPLNDIMTSCQKLIEPTADQHGIRLQMGDECFAGHRLHADYTRTKQVLLNLLSNAIKYNRAHGSVSVSCRRDDEMLRIEVQDTGPGIPAHKLNKLFEAFNRLGAESGSIEGTGIGLIITRQLVEMMGGELGVDSVEGEGSTFWFTLPWLARQEAGGSAAPATEAGTPARLSGQQKVLYIEDNPVNLKLVEKLIARQTELELISAVEPITGIELALSERPDLILLDINLPTMSGYEVAHKLREMEETRTIPIVALTANAMASDVARGEAAGFDDYLTKPMQIKAFLEVLKRYLGNG